MQRKTASRTSQLAENVIFQLFFSIPHQSDRIILSLLLRSTDAVCFADLVQFLEERIGLAEFSEIFNCCHWHVKLCIA